MNYFHYKYIIIPLSLLLTSCEVAFISIGELPEFTFTEGPIMLSQSSSEGTEVFRSTEFIYFSGIGIDRNPCSKAIFKSEKYILQNYLVVECLNLLIFSSKQDAQETLKFSFSVQKK